MLRNIPTNPRNANLPRYLGVTASLFFLKVFSAKGNSTRPPIKNLISVICTGLKSPATSFNTVSMELKSMVVTAIQM